MERSQIQDLHEYYILQFDQWLAGTVASQSRRVYVSRVRNFFATLEKERFELTMIFLNPELRRNAIVFYKKLMRGKLKPRTINCTVSAVNFFFEFKGLAPISIECEYWTKVWDRTLNEEGQARLIEHVSKFNKARDKAIIMLLLFSGIKIGECANLNVDDLIVENNCIRMNVKAASRVVSTIESVYKMRELELPHQVARTIYEWIVKRQNDLENAFEPALFVNHKGRRMTVQNIEMTVRRAGWVCDLRLSAEVLRRTYYLNKHLRETGQTARAFLTQAMAMEELVASNFLQTESI